MSLIISSRVLLVFWILWAVMLSLTTMCLTFSEYAISLICWRRSLRLSNVSFSFRNEWMSHVSASADCKLFVIREISSARWIIIVEIILTSVYFFIGMSRICISNVATFISSNVGLHFPWLKTIEIGHVRFRHDFWKKKKIKAVFSEENYVPNRKLSRQACLLLFIVSQWYRLKSINHFIWEHAQTQFWSIFETTKCCSYLEYKVNVIKI